MFPYFRSSSSCQLCAKRWASHTALWRARPVWDRSFAARPSPAWLSPQSTQRTRPAWARLSRSARPTSTNATTRWESTVAAVSWAPSHRLALPSSRRSRLASSPRRLPTNSVLHQPNKIIGKKNKQTPQGFSFFLLLKRGVGGGLGTLDG